LYKYNKGFQLMQIKDKVAFKQYLIAASLLNSSRKFLLLLYMYSLIKVSFFMFDQDLASIFQRIGNDGRSR